MIDSLRDAVEAQAQAYVGGDDALFASYMTPQALLQLRGNGHGAPRRFDVLELKEGGGLGTSAVRYRGSGTFVLRQHWERIDGSWKAIDAERTVHGGSFWRRVIGVWRNAPSESDRHG